jgi:hypothetical protein
MISDESRGVSRAYQFLLIFDSKGRGRECRANVHLFQVILELLKDSLPLVDKWTLLLLFQNTDFALPSFSFNLVTKRNSYSAVPHDLSASLELDLVLVCIFSAHMHLHLHFATLQDLQIDCLLLRGDKVNRLWCDYNQGCGKLVSQEPELRTLVLVNGKTSNTVPERPRF